MIDSGEICDEGENNSDDVIGGCGTNCAPTTCGNGVLDPLEECDDGDNNSDTRADACRSIAQGLFAETLLLTLLRNAIQESK